ncbi:hypothetical protein CLIB1423_04S02146 [[Candida] railenensis]|uniref:Uncharacterized protein n=1 Tax=[Candida] railenensis TaxID=45579 RepID=A0A9P0VXK3_9ASCO|nr:hypothetical protein CLIB1423_04S02146 [[Candida] railenensis]
MYGSTLSARSAKFSRHDRINYLENSLEGEMKNVKSDEILITTGESNRSPMLQFFPLEEFKRMNFEPIDLSSINFKLHSTPTISNYFDLVNDLNLVLRVVNEDNRKKYGKQVQLNSLIQSIEEGVRVLSPKETSSYKAKPTKPVKSFKLSDSPNYYGSMSESEFTESSR